MHSSPRYFPIGDSALLVKFGDVIDLQINHAVHALFNALEKAKINGVDECVPAYASLLVYYDPLKISYDRLVFQLKDLEPKLEFDNREETHEVLVPTVYGSEYGPDLSNVARAHGLKEEDVVRIHSNNEYVVYMIGFIAGFPYLGRVPDSIATPRLERPRVRIPAGSVGIAGNQTGIYPCESPGGWQIIGRTPLTLFNPHALRPALFQPGDHVRFRPINADELEKRTKRA
ncbi:MAG TPA: 5-oxoprolinase subunit PxpB [Candidatus Bathyarchaeia archaeon]|nr:5-oxoprolinase subunit PxpB [Candidatus Bathyarchaeia archaeon]